MLASKAQIVIFWGRDYCALYNDAYIPTMGSKHPDHLGRPGRDMWAEAWSVLQELFDGVAAGDEAFYGDDYLFMLERFGFLEETYFDISYDPIRRADGTVGGVFCIVSDTTAPGAGRPSGPHAQRSGLPAGRLARPGRARRPGRAGARRERRRRAVRRPLPGRSPRRRHR